VAEKLGRTPYGIEADPKRFEWTAGQLKHWQNMIFGDSANLASYNLPKMDFCITSPPFMSKDQKANPLFAGNPKHAGYTKYLAQLGYIFSLTASIMKKGAHVVVHVENIHGRTYTPLVSDMQQVISTSFEPVGETIIQWTSNTHPTNTHSHCLIFRKK
jgi:hypothetical protein